MARELTNNETAIREIFDKWAAAVRAEDINGIRANHSPDMLMFDVPPPVLRQNSVRARNPQFCTISSIARFVMTMVHVQLRPAEFGWRPVAFARVADYFWRIWRFASNSPY